jgi:hypothetical protein
MAAVRLGRRQDGLGRCWEGDGKEVVRRVNHGSESRRRWEGGGEVWEGGGEVGRRWEARCGGGHDMTAVMLGRRKEGWERAG